MPSHLKDLGQRPEKRESEVADTVFYPSIYLDDDQVEKLGLTGASVGDERLLVAHVRVTRVSSSEHENEDERETERHRSVSLDLTEAVVEPVPTRSQAARMFGEGEDGA